MSEKRPKIHIAVACHKPSRYPKNEIFVPVQVNSAHAEKRLDMAHDDDGINISGKNYSYCELTAQYWEWKNVDADYYGLCHYRRFPCFKVPDNIKWNNRAQIVSETIDDWSIKRFGLDDEENMRRIIEANDVVTGLEQDIKGVSTPKGDQPTAWKHWMAQHRVVIMQEDLLKFMRVLKEEAPQLAKDAEEYLRGKKFLGFNCFVMKKEYFNELCEAEFRVLERLEREIKTDVSRYSVPVSRFYGYMGEIISSAFIYQLKKRGAKVLNLPLVYFNHTDPEQQFPRTDSKAIPVLFYHISDRGELFATTWQSFLSHQNPNQRYDAIIFDRGANKAMRDSLAKMAAGFDNISVRFVDADVFINGLKERFFSLGISWKENLRKKIVTVDDEVRFPALPFLLCDLTELDEAVVIGDRTLLQTAPDELWNEKLGEGEIAAAPLDPFRLARVEYFYPESDHNEYIKDYANGQIEDFSEHHFTAVMKIDLNRFRKLVDYENLYNCITNPNGFIRDDSEVLNVLLSGHFRTVKQNWCTMYECNSYLEYQLPYTPLYVHRELLKARRDPYVITYMLDDPFYPFYTEITERFWTEARKTPFYEMLLDRKTYVWRKEMTKPQQLTRRMLKRGSKMHSVVSFAFPVGSRRYKFMKKILSLFHAE